MLVVLEGLPGTGKTTAIHRLAENGYNIINEIIGSEPVGVDEEFFIRNDINKYNLIDSNRINIMDRNFVSTLCYNYCSDKQNGTNNYNRISKKIENALGQGLLSHPDVYILLSCSVEVSKLRQNESNDTMWSKVEFLQLVDEFYTKYFDQIGRRVVKINTETKNIKSVSNAINDVLIDTEQINNNSIGRKIYA
ncbi:hypothetical protein H7X68_03910 [Candidatus Saccharibacteria bacterium]|nr:hypothetical protein [Candidatus Saccharibacteria bacterium]